MGGLTFITPFSYVFPPNEQLPYRVSGSISERQSHRQTVDHERKLAMAYIRSPRLAFFTSFEYVFAMNVRSWFALLRLPPSPWGEIADSLLLFFTVPPRGVSGYRPVSPPLFPPKVYKRISPISWTFSMRCPQTFDSDRLWLFTSRMDGFRPCLASPSVLPYN